MVALLSIYSKEVLLKNRIIYDTVFTSKVRGNLGYKLHPLKDWDSEDCEAVPEHCAEGFDYGKAVRVLAFLP